MRSVRRSAALLLPLLLLLGAAQADQKAFVSPSAFDFDALIGQPPTDDSQKHKDELDKMLAMQAARTPDEEARCKAEVSVTPFVFAEVVGPWFNTKDLPKTSALLRKVTREATQIADVPKQKWHRVRPPLANPQIHPCVPLEHTGSFPSGHATRGIVWATIVSEIFPEEREQIMARGKQIGDDRVLAGMHYPSDVVAGQALGAAIAQKLLANPDFVDELNKVKLECHAAGLVHH
jgi:acid phosphatase (class A)